MTLDEMKEKAKERVKKDNPDCSGFNASRAFENIMDGTLVTVTFFSAAGKEDSNQVHFGRNETRVYRWMSDVMSAVSGTRERNWFFRFIEVAGIGGLIGFTLVIVFSILLFGLAITPNKDVNPTILEVVKLSFTLILGYFFGSQTSAKK